METTDDYFRPYRRYLGDSSLTATGSTPSIIYDGRCYQTITKVINGVSQTVWECFDLRTGQVYWDQTGITQVPTMISYVGSTVAMVPDRQQTC